MTRTRSRRSCCSRSFAGAVLALLAAPVHAGDLVPVPETTVGMTGRLDGVVLPGPELEAKPLTDRRSPIVLRVVQTYPHGTAFRYDLEYFGLEAGTHDLSGYLRRKDGSPTGDLPSMLLTVKPVLPPGQVRPNPLAIDPGPRVGGYRVLLFGLGALWAAGLAAIVASFVFPRRKQAAAVTDRPVSLADRLRPLVEGAVAGRLSRAELANLERSLLSYWRKRLGLETAAPGEAVAALRQHPEAGTLLARLEDWLHRPGTPELVDVPALLAPYRDLPAEAIDLPDGAPGQVVAT